MSSQNVLNQFEQYVKTHFSGILSISPKNSLTPFEIANTITNQTEFLFIANCTPDVYEPLEGRDIRLKTNINLTMYNENNSLIVRFDILDLFLESEIVNENIKRFLHILKEQEYITLVVVDSETLEVIWVTNMIPFKSVRSQYQEIFNLYSV